MKTYIYFIQLFIILCLFNSCTGETQDKTIRKIKKDQTISSLNNDSIIWGKQVPCIDYNNEKLYIADYQTDKLIIADKNLNFIHSIGERGEGPGFFLGLSQFFIQDSLYYIYNDGKRTIELYCRNNYVKQIPFPENAVPYPPNRFFVKDKIIFFPDYRTNSIVCFDEEGKAQKIISVLKEEQKKQPPILFKAEGSRFIAVGTDIPKVGIYTYEGELIEEYDLYKIPIVKEKVDHIKTLPAQNNISLLFKDAYYNNETIYLLFYDYVLTFSLNPQIELKIIYKLEDLFYQKFCIMEETLFLFNGYSGEFDLYNLKR